MIDLAEIGRLDLKDQTGRQRLDALLGEVASYAETRSAAEIAQLLQQKAAADQSLASMISPFIAKFRMLALPLLTDDQALEQVRSVGQVIGDERIGTYERFRARLLVLPPSRRTGFSQQLLAALRQSSEQFAGATVRSWVSRAEQVGGLKPAEALFAQADFKRLDDVADHAVRHLVHLVQLLATPESVETRSVPLAPVQRPVARPAPVPTAPPNLPVGPAPAPAAPPQPVPVPPVPATVLVQPAPTPDRGPSLAAVLARLHQSGQDLAAEPPTVAHLTPEDHQEIKQHAQKLEQYDVGPNVHDTLADEIERMIKTFGLTFADDHLHQRFVTIVTSRLKEIRSANDVLELLTRPVKVGGLGFDQSRAQQIVQQANAIAASFHNEDQLRQIADRQQATINAPLPKPPKVPSVPQAEAPLPPLPTAPVQPIPIPFRPTLPVAPRPRPAVSVSAPPMPTASLRSAISDRPTVSDIRGSSRLVGPIEELRGLSLTDYRRLGPDAVSCVRRVYEKIQRLGKESFTKKAEGVRAWRESVVHRLYVAIGQESLLSGKAIRDVIAARQQSGQPALTEEEFNYVADLNKKLRF